MILSTISTNEERHLSSGASDNDYLQELQHRLLLVIAETDLAKTFTGKWAIIRNKLQFLSLQLADLAGLPGFLQNPLCKDIIESISGTLNDAQELLKKCVDMGCDIGKLHMKSGLDVLIMNLNQRFQEFELLKASGILQESPTPPLFSQSKTVLSREGIRCLCRELVVRLQIGDLESRRKVLDSLLALLEVDDKNVLLIAGLGGVPVLVRMLDSGFVEIRERATAAVSVIAKIGSCERLLVSEGSIPSLIRIMESGTSIAKQNAVTALQALSDTPENARSVGTRCGVSALVEICQSGTPAAQAAAVGTIRNIAIVPDVKQKIVDENAIPVLLRLCASGTTLAQQYAVDCLGTLASDDEGVGILIAKEEGILPLLYFWDRSSGATAQEIALRALKNISGCKKISASLISAGYVPRLVNALRIGNATVQQLAALSISELAHSMEIRRLLGECGCIPLLVKMLEAKIAGEQEAAAQSLSVLLLCDFNKRLFRKEGKGVSRTVKLLDPSNQGVDKNYPISILLGLSSYPKCKKQMVASGACIHLQKLVESETAGAKKLLECLRRVHIWNFFGRP